jgi:AT-rich interactive domain-containing protein 4B
MSDDSTDETEAAVTDREPTVEDDEGHGIDVDGGGDAGASAPEETEEVDAPHQPESEPDTEDERREEEAKDQENVDNHRDEEPFES